MSAVPPRTRNPAETKVSTLAARESNHAVGNSLHGWHRLRRFQTAMTFPAIEAAATHLGADQSALIHQFWRSVRQT
jgi:hypothetical protein